jgi:hypothetical protein
MEVSIPNRGINVIGRNASLLCGVARVEHGQPEPLRCCQQECCKVPVAQEANLVGGVMKCDPGVCAMSREVDDVRLDLVQVLQQVSNSDGRSILEGDRVAHLAGANPILDLADFAVDAEMRDAVGFRREEKHCDSLGRVFPWSTVELGLRLCEFGFEYGDLLVTRCVGFAPGLIFSFSIAFSLSRGAIGCLLLASPIGFTLILVVCLRSRQSRLCLMDLGLRSGDLRRELGCSGPRCLSVATPPISLAEITLGG